MNDTTRIDVETCILGLKEAVLDVLTEAKGTGERLGVAKVRDRSGTRDQFPDQASQEWDTPFTRTLLVSLEAEGRVRHHGTGHGSYWEVTD